MRGRTLGVEAVRPVVAVDVDGVLNAGGAPNGWTGDRSVTRWRKPAAPPETRNETDPNALLL